MRASWRDEWLEPMVGAFLGTSLVAAGVALVFSLFGGAFGATTWFVLELDDGVGLAQGNDVTISGVRVGSVQSVELTPDRRVRLVLTVDDAHAGLVRADTLGHATYTTTGKVVRLEGGTAEAGPLPEGGVLHGTNFDPIAAIERMDLVGNLEKVQGILEQISLLAEELGMGEDQVPETVAALQGIVLDLREGKGTLGRLLKDDETLRALDTTMADVKAMADALERAAVALEGASTQVVVASGAIGEVSDDVERTASSLEASAGSITSSSQQLGQSLKSLDATMAELGRTMRAIQQLPFVRGKMEDEPRP